MRGFDILKNAKSPHSRKSHRFDLDIADIWRKYGGRQRDSRPGCSISPLPRSRTTTRWDQIPATSRIPGEGRWNVNARSTRPCRAEVRAALYARFRSQQDHTFAEKILRRCAPALAATRNRQRNRDRKA